MLKYFTSLLLLVLTSTQSFAQQADGDTVAAKPGKRRDSVNQLRLEVEAGKPVINYFQTGQEEFHFSADVYLKKEIYLVAEGGWGSSSIDYDYLSYNSTNSFFKLGINKSLLVRAGKHDWDMAFVGLRYGVGLTKRSNATYTIIDNFWGNITGSIPGKDITGHWLELNGGVRVELYKCIFAGWNVCAKFRINQGLFQELPPAYIAGYGKGDKNTVFDFNFYLGYAIRWDRISPNSKVKGRKWGL